MQRFIVERDMPAVGSLEREALRAAIARSVAVMRGLGPGIQWEQSYVAGDKTYCVYLANDEALIRRHAEMAGLPVTQIARVGTTIDLAELPD
jgi:hypothetical protein